MAICSPKDIVAGKVQSNTNVGQAFPNPTDQLINLDLNLPDLMLPKNTCEVNIVDVLGRVMDSRKIEYKKGVERLTFDVSSFPRGIYQIIIPINEEIFIRKFVVAN